MNGKNNPNYRAKFEREPAFGDARGINREGDTRILAVRNDGEGGEKKRERGNAAVTVAVHAITVRGGIRTEKESYLCGSETSGRRGVGGHTTTSGRGAREKAKGGGGDVITLSRRDGRRGRTRENGKGHFSRDAQTVVVKRRESHAGRRHPGYLTYLYLCTLHVNGNRVRVFRARGITVPVGRGRGPTHLFAVQTFGNSAGVAGTFRSQRYVNNHSGEVKSNGTKCP